MARITADEALERLQGTGMRKAKGAQMTLLRSIKQTRQDRVFLFSDGITMKICPADDALSPVLAEFSSADTLPPALSNWLLGYAQEVKYYQEKGRKVTQVLKAPAMAKANAAPILIEPLLGNNTWGQDAPFNNNLKFGSTKCVVGCVATAMSQVLYYWATKGRRRGCRATSAYTTKTNNYAVAALPSVAMFDWDSMSDAAPTTALGKKAVAELCQYMGALVKMDYGKTGSYAYISKVAPAMKNYLNIPTAERLEQRYTTSGKFKARLIAELQEGRPVIMCGGSSSIDGSHCFVSDGYDSSIDMFHMNWGWNGHCNGWFALTALTTYNGDFTTKKNAILGVCPSILGDVNSDGKINMSDVTAAIKAQKDYTVAADVNFDGKVDQDDTQLIIDKILNRK